MECYDILIVGGGPAGSSLAWALQGAGLSVAILDKREFPRQKVCAGWVTPEVIRLLEIDLEDYARGRVLQPINGFGTGILGNRLVECSFTGEPVSYGIRRLEFDEYLLQRCGARLLLGESFAKMEREDGRWVVNDQYAAELVVGAGGHNCPVARAIGAKHPGETAVVAQEAEFSLSPQEMAQCRVKEDVPELFFTPDLKGYGWVFRKGDYLNIGLGREDKKQLPAHVEAFANYLDQEGKIPRRLIPDFEGHAYLLYNHANREMLAEQVLLIGDAVGLAYPQSGEGIRPAVESAFLAAGVIQDAAGEYQQAQLLPYKHAMEARFGERMAPPGWMERLPAVIKRQFANYLLRTVWFTRDVVIRRWFLQSHQPVLQTRR